jgi:hypothetical protein
VWENHAIIEEEKEMLIQISPDPTLGVYILAMLCIWICMLIWDTNPRSTESFSPIGLRTAEKFQFLSVPTDYNNRHRNHRKAGKKREEKKGEKKREKTS